MRQLIVDRHEGKFTICEDQEQKYFAIENSELPHGVKSGDILRIDDDGAISLDLEETKARKDRISKKQSNAFK